MEYTRRAAETADRHRFGGTRIAAHKHHGIRSLTIQANIFRRGDRDDHLGHALKHRPDTCGILIKT